MKEENKLRMLFSSNSSNSVREDPPNAVLVTQEGQCTYEIIKLEITNNIVRMEMKVLSDDLKNISGRMSLFMDWINTNVYYANNYVYCCGGGTVFSMEESYGCPPGSTLIPCSAWNTPSGLCNSGASPSGRRCPSGY